MAKHHPPQNVGAAPRSRPTVGATGRSPLQDTIRDALVATAAFACPLVWNQPVLLGTTAHRGHAVIMTLAVLAWLAHIIGGIVRGAIRLPRPWVAAPAAAVVFAAVLSSITSVNKNASLLFVLQLGTGALLFCLVAVPGNSRTRRWAVAAMVAAGCLVAILALREYAQQRAAGGEVWRAFALFFNPNLLAGFLAVVIPLAVAGIATQNRLARIAFAYAALLMLVALVLTGSRGGWLAFLTGALILFAVAGVAVGRARLGLIGALGAVLAATALAIALPPLRARLATAFSGQEHLFRALTWKATLRIAAAYPVLGSGPGTFEFVFPKYAIAGFTRMAHQNYLQVLAENGPAGLAAFLWLMALGVVMSARAVRRGESPDRLAAAACLAGIGASLAHGFIDYTWFVGGIATTIWLLAGIGAGLGAPPGGEMVVSVPRKSRALVALAAFAAAIALLFLPVSAAIAEGYALIGERALRAADRPQAEANLRAAVAWAPLDGTYRQLLGVAVGGTEGIRCLRSAVALEPTAAQPHAWLGRLFLYQGQPDAARKEFQAAIRLNPNYTSAWLELAGIWLAHGRLRDAERAYNAVVRIEKSPYGQVHALEQRVDTDFAFAHYGLGLLSLGTDDAKANSEFRLAINMILDYESKQKRLDQALEDTGQAIPVRTGEVQRLKAKVLWRLSMLAKGAGSAARYKDLRARALQADPEVQATIDSEDALLTHAVR